MAKPVNSDQKTLALINDVKARKAEIQKILGKPSFETNMSFSYSEGKSNDNVNLHTVTSVSDLVKIASYLSTREDSYDEMSKALQVEDPTPVHLAGIHGPPVVVGHQDPSRQGPGGQEAEEAGSFGSSSEPHHQP